MEDKEMRSTQSILEEYWRADLEKRLNLFLECPSLRNRFQEIDESEIAGGLRPRRGLGADGKASPTVKH
jgi:hypothetical protein